MAEKRKLEQEEEEVVFVESGDQTPICEKAGVDERDTGILSPVAEMEVEAEEPLPAQSERLFHASSDPDVLRLGEPLATRAMSPFHFEESRRVQDEAENRGAVEIATQHGEQARPRGRHC